MGGHREQIMGRRACTLLLRGSYRHAEVLLLHALGHHAAFLLASSRQTNEKKDVLDAGGHENGPVVKIAHLQPNAGVQPTDSTR